MARVLTTRISGPVVVAVALLCQPAAETSQQQATFRSGVEYVTVDVVVTDRDGRPVAGLTREDFEILDGGRNQSVAEFLYVGHDPRLPSDRSAPESHRSLDVVTNGPIEPASRLFAVLIDDLHLLASDLPATSSLLAELLAARDPADIVSITYTGRSDLGQDFTNDTSRLAAAVDRLSESSITGFSYGSGTVSLPADYPDYMNGTRSTIDTLRSVVAALDDAPNHRRAVVLVSAGLAIDRSTPACTSLPGYARSQDGCSNAENRWGVDLQRQLEAVFEEAERAGTPIYTIDPRGLPTPELAVANYWRIASPETASAVRRRIRIQQGFLSEVAGNTGGKAYINRSDPTEAIRELLADNGSYYLLGFYPDPYRGDGQFHRIEVNVRGEGLNVRARHGYVADDPASKPGPGRPSLNASLRLSVPDASIPLRAFAAPLDGSENGVRTAVVVEAAYPPGGDSADDEILLTVVAVDADARPRVESSHAVTIRLGPSDDARLISLGDLVVLPAGEFTLRVGMWSEALGDAGTAFVPVVVPDLSRGPLRLSALVLGSARRAPPSAGPEALRALVPFQPTLSRQFVTAETLQVLAHTNWPAGGQAPVVTARITSPSGVIVFENGVSIEPLGRNDRNGQGRGRVIAEIPLAGLVAGLYTLELTATVAGGESTTTAVPIEIWEEPSEMPAIASSSTAPSFAWAPFGAGGS